jgi:hypothetical protein
MTELLSKNGAFVPLVKCFDLCGPASATLGGDGVTATAGQLRGSPSDPDRIFNYEMRV